MTRTIKYLTILVLLCLLTPLPRGARAQQGQESPTPTPPLNDGYHIPSAEKTADSEVLTSLMQKIDDTLTGHGKASLQKGAYHFVVLMDTSRTQGGGAQMMRDLYHGLLFDYLVPADEPAVGGANQTGPANDDTVAADMVSFYPFQLRIRDEGNNASRAKLRNQRFTSEAATRLFQAVPLSPSKEIMPDGISTYNGGHDQGRALLTALGEIASPKSAVVILLSDGGDTSITPDNAPKYSLADQAPDFQNKVVNAGFFEALRDTVTRPAFDGNGQEKKDPVKVYYHVYLPGTGPSAQTLVPIASLPDDRKNLSGVDEPSPPLDPSRVPDVTHPDSDNNQTEANQKVLVGLFGATLLGGLGVAAFMATRSQSVHVAGAIINVSPRSRHYIVPDASGKAFMVTQNEAEAGGAVAWCEKPPFGASRINTDYEIAGDEKPLVLTPDEQAVVLKQNGNPFAQFKAKISSGS